MVLMRSLVIPFVLGLSLGLLHVWNYPGALSCGGNVANLSYIIGPMVVVVLISSVPRLRGIGAIAVVMLLALTSYAYRFEIQRVGQHVVGALMPYRDEQAGKGSASFEAWPDGQFQTDATINGTPVRFLVDTGATVRDAERLGYRPEQPDFSNRYTTANGAVMGAPRRPS
jgi:aspartyl protease family protein